MLRRSLDTRTITWKPFVNTFYEKYFSQSVANQMEREFLDSNQGNKFVVEYENKFKALFFFIDLLRHWLILRRRSVDIFLRDCDHLLETLVNS